jgi:chromosome segregation ATPase
MFGSKKEVKVEAEAPEEAPVEKVAQTELSLPAISAEVDKLKAQFSSFYEMQKAANERFSRLNEQIGELRAMIVDRDRATQHLEAKATQAIDLVETVQPEKLMIEVRKSDTKIEALRANLESNEAIMGNTVNELKDIRNRMMLFKGMDEVVKLNEDVKKELSEIKMVESVVERHADKVDTIFAEMQKSFSEYIKLTDTLKSLDLANKQLSADTDEIKVKLKELAGKKEVTTFTNRMDEFEKKVSTVVNLLNERFLQLEKKLTSDTDMKMEKATKLLTGFDTLAKKTPDLDKYFNLLTEEAKRAETVQVEKIKQPGEETPAMEQAKPEKKGMMSGLFKKK